MQLYTIGFTRKNAQKFFGLLSENNVKKVIDVRLNNSSQLAGFAKADDLKFFLSSLCEIDYVEEKLFAPTKEILDSYKKGEISWKDYEKEYELLMRKRKISEYIEKQGKEYWNDCCFLCSENQPDNCHRRLAALEVLTVFPELDVKHLM